MSHTIGIPHFQLLCDKLHCLSSFLDGYLERRRQRGGLGRYGGTGGAAPGHDGLAMMMLAGGAGAGAGTGGDGADGPQGQAAKRQRLMHAMALEDERTSHIR